MDNLVDKEREAKLMAIENFLSFWLHPAPLKPELSGGMWNLRQMAEKILAEIEQVEIEFEDRYFQAKEQSRG